MFKLNFIAVEWKVPHNQAMVISLFVIIHAYFKERIFSMAKASKKDTALKVWLKMHRSYMSVLAISGEKLKEHKLNEVQFGVLDYLVNKGSCKIGILCKKMMVSGGNMTLILDYLEKQSLVRRIHSKTDRRSIDVEATEKGAKLYDKVLSDYGESLQELFAVLSEKELENFAAYLKKVGTSIGLAET